MSEILQNDTHFRGCWWCKRSLFLPLLLCVWWHVANQLEWTRHWTKPIVPNVKTPYEKVSEQAVILVRCTLLRSCPRVKPVLVNGSTPSHPKWPLWTHKENFRCRLMPGDSYLSMRYSTQNHRNLDDWEPSSVSYFSMPPSVYHPHRPLCLPNKAILLYSSKKTYLPLTYTYTFCIV